MPYKDKQRQLVAMRVINRKARRKHKEYVAKLKDIVDSLTRFLDCV